MTVTAQFTAVPPAGAPELRVTMEIDPSVGDPLSPNTGDDVPVLVTVANVGPAGATNVTVSVPLPENLEFISGRVLSDLGALATPAEFSVQDGTVLIGIGDLAAGQQVRLELVLRAMAVGAVELAALAASDETAEPVASAPVEITITDEYYTIVQASRPELCGLPGLFPLVTVLGLVSLKRRRPRGR